MHATTAALIFAVSAYAQTIHNVTVTDDYTFEPDTLTDVAEGDEIRVQFDDHAHDIVSSTFESPCVYDDSGDAVNSGILDDNEVFTFTVNSTDTQWFFCSYGTHCQQGMALVINPGSDQTIEEYQTAAAEAETMNEGVAEPVGGQVMTMDQTDDATTDDTTTTEEEDTMDDTADDSAAVNLQSSLALVAASVAAMVAFVV